ncbi:hypothetical protein MMC20_004648 [Loxospora ochrophaea]|nr:hypothetical protein [Loxospora ochrophaea]
MDSMKSAVGMGGDDSNQPTQQGDQSSGGGFLGGIGNKISSVTGGGTESEKGEDLLCKGIDAVQEHTFGQGKQDDEPKVEHAKDEQISDFIRGQYKSDRGK